MQMREAGVARQAHQPERLSCRDPVALLDHQAAAAEMAVPGGPAVAVGEANAVAALLAFHRLPPRLADAHVRHAVAERVDHARRRRPHLDSRRHRRQIADRDVGALVPVATQAAAHVVADAGTGIVVDVAQQPAVGAGPAVDRQRQIMG